MGINKVDPPKKVGLALGSGAARGLSHIGVLRVLEQEGIPIDMIAGTSIGALIGSFYAHGRSADKIAKLAIDLGENRLNFLINLSLPKTGLMRGRRLNAILKSVIRDTRFSDLRIPFACVATDIDSGEEVVLNEGLVRDAARASCSLPVIFSVVKNQSRYLVDGGLVNPVPVSVLKSMGADIIIAVNVIPPHEVPGTAHHNIFTVVMRTIHISRYGLIKASLDEADIVIEPRVDDIGYADFQRADDSILRGEQAARQAVPGINKLLALSK